MNSLWKLDQLPWAIQTMPFEIALKSNTSWQEIEIGKSFFHNERFVLQGSFKRCRAPTEERKDSLITDEQGILDSCSSINT